MDDWESSTGLPVSSFAPSLIPYSISQSKSIVEMPQPPSALTLGTICRQGSTSQSTTGCSPMGRYGSASVRTLSMGEGGDGVDVAGGGGVGTGSGGGVGPGVDVGGGGVVYGLCPLGST